MIAIPAFRALFVPVIALAMFSAVLAPSHASAQAANGTLLGNVRDESGAAVPGAVDPAAPSFGAVLSIGAAGSCMS